MTKAKIFTDNQRVSLRQLLAWPMLALGLLSWLALAAPVLAGSAGEQTFTSRRYGYGFHHPAECHIKEASGGAYLDISPGGRRLLTASVQVLDETGKMARRFSPDPWREFILERAKLSGDADGPDGTVYCRGVAQEGAWKTSSSLRVIELYLLQVEERFGPPRIVKTSLVGPLYAVDISRAGYVFGLLVGSGHEYPRTPQEKDLIKKLVASVHLLPESDFQPPRPNLVGPGPRLE